MPYRDLQRPAAPAPTERVRWVPRETPLAPVAVVGFGDVARALARRLLRRTDGGLVALQGVAAPELLAVVGAEAELPWADGALYLGRDADATTLYLPTALRPDVHVTLFERAFVRGRTIESPVAVVPGDRGLTAFSLAAARPVSRERLAAWMGG